MTEASDAPERRAAPWRGRPRVKDPRDRFIGVKCTAEEHAAILAAAEHAGMTVGAFLRHQATGTAGPRAARRPQVDKVELGRALGLLGLHSSNVNQLARAANMHGDQLTAAQLEGVLADHRDLRGIIRRALGYGD